MDKLNIGETEDQFSTRLATNLKNLILKEGPETVIWKDISVIQISLVVIFNDITFFLKLLFIFLLFQIAAFIAEPVMGAGGVIPPPEGYFEKVGFL